MIVYEVNLHIKQEAYDAFYAWLLPHINQMLDYKGFLTAELLKNEEHPHKLTVIYHIDNREDLEHYLQHHAAQMRDEGIKHFSGQFSAERRIFSVEQRMASK